MSAQYRAEVHKLCSKYARTFGIGVELVSHRNLRGEDEIHCPSRPDLPVWGMGGNSEDWEDGPDRPRNLQGLSDKPKFKVVSRRKR